MPNDTQNRPELKDFPPTMASTGSITLARRGLAALTALAAIDGVPTDQQRKALAGWPGWGPLAPAFDPEPAGTWPRIVDQLHEFFDTDPEAYNTAAECVDNAFYTPPVVIDAIYSLLRAAGFTGGAILEPGCGSGGFFARCPGDWDINFVGVESDRTSARIAAALYPAATILRSPLQKTNLNRNFDAVIGNVPFANSYITDPAHPHGGAKLHNYFIWRALDSVREGGYVILVTSRHTMDGGNLGGLIADLADFIGAVRLPTGAFHAEGTDVIADVIVLRKNTTGPWPSAPLASAGKHWITHPTAPHREVQIHGYFAQHPEHVAGQLIATGYHQNPLEVRTDDIPAAINAAFAALTTHLLPILPAGRRPEAVMDIAMTDTHGRKEGSYHLLPDGLMIRIDNGQPVEIKVNAELRALVQLRDQATALLVAEADYDTPDTDLAEPRAELLAAYTRYLDKYGPLNRGHLHEGTPDPDTGLPNLTWRRPAMGGFRRDPDYLTVLALEVYDPDTGHAEPAPFLTRRVNRRPVRIERADNPAEAVAICLGEGRFDLTRIAGLLNLPTEADTIAALGDLVYADPDAGGRWVPARDYLAGDVRTKLATARAAATTDPAYHRNVAALLAVQPADLGPLDIAVSLGVPWVTPADIADFLQEVFGNRITVEHCEATASWEVNTRYATVSVAARSTYGTQRLNGYKLVELALNGKAPVVYDEFYDQTTGTNRKVRNPEETLAAQEKLTVIQDRFATWLWENAERSARVCAEYNRMFNSHVARRFDNPHLVLHGLADGEPMWASQLSIIDQVCSSRSTLCGHAAGGGKTRSMVGAAVRARRLGLANKPMVVVPNHLLEQIAREARQIFPTASFLMVSKEDLAGDRRRLFAARCATGDWDAVIITHAGFTSIPVLPDTETDWLFEQKALLNDHLRSGDGGHFGAKEIARKLRSLETKLTDLRSRASDPATVAFEHLGVDLLLIDEGHYFKRLPITSRREGFSFGASKRATDLLLKSQLLYRSRGDLPCLALFTGTPWSNTLAETFVWQTYLQPEALAAAGVAAFDTWSQVFVVFETVVEVAPDGSGFRTATRPMRMRNLPELKRMLHQVADVRSAADLGLEVPDHITHTVVAQQSEQQRGFVQELVERAELYRTGRPVRPNDNMLAICGDGQRVALDPRLVGLDEDSPKVGDVAATVAGIYHQHRTITLPGANTPGVFQIIFCDQGTPGANGAQTYGRIRQDLIRLGVPAEQIRWVHEAKDDKAKEALFNACRDGSVAVLIGSTEKLGVGTNVQQRLRALHNADAPWRPSDVEQRFRRGVRPGNLNPVVDDYRYVTEGTFDAYMWQTLARKAVFISQMYDLTDNTVREVGDIGDMVLSFTEVKALAAGNPMLLEQAEAAAAVKRLRILRAVDAQAFNAATRAITRAEREIEECTRLLDILDQAQRQLAAEPSDNHQQQAVRSAATLVQYRLAGRSGTTSYHTAMFTWRGLTVRVEPNQGWWQAKKSDRIKITLDWGYETIREVTPPIGNFRRSAGHATAALTKALTEIVDGLPVHTDRTRARIRYAHNTIEQAQQVVDGYAFSHADELAAAEARLARIEAEIAAAAAEPAAA